VARNREEFIYILMFSLIVTTLGRTIELDRLLDSLDKQTYQKFEVIIVDQNSDERLGPIVARHPNLTIRHVRSARGASLGRNCGLRLAQGEIVATPDDDCWYPEDLLDKVRTWFAEHREFDGLFTSIRDEKGQLQKRRRRGSIRLECDRNTLWYYGIEFNSFFRKSTTDSVGEYDERLGPGAATGFYSGEGGDYFLRVLDQGSRIFFEPSFSVYHAFMREPARELRQAYPYALGTSFVLKKHRYPLRVILSDFILYSFAGAAVAFVQLDWVNFRVRTLRGIGLVVGYLRSAKLLQDSRNVHVK
jgi:glycosyltransferase involved in cell wall biosynthesis